MRVGQAIGRGDGEWSGCSGVGIEDLLGLFVGEFEFRAVILEKFPVVLMAWEYWRSTAVNSKCRCPG